MLIYSNQKLRPRYRFGRALIEDLQRKTNCYYALKPIDQVLIALQFYASGGLLQVVGDTTGVDKSTCSLAVHNADGNNHSAYPREIALWDTNCRLAWFLHHVLTVNQRLTTCNLPSNRALNNVFNYSD